MPLSRRRTGRKVIRRALKNPANQKLSIGQNVYELMPTGKIWDHETGENMRTVNVHGVTYAKTKTGSIIGVIGGNLKVVTDQGIINRLKNLPH